MGTKILNDYVSVHSNFIGNWFLKEHADGYKLDPFNNASSFLRQNYGSPGGTTTCDGYVLSGINYNGNIEPFNYAYLHSGVNASNRCGQLVSPLSKSHEEHFKPSAILFLSRIRIGAGASVIPNYAMLLSAVKISMPDANKTTFNNSSAPYPNFGIYWTGSGAKIFASNGVDNYTLKSLDWDGTNNVGKWFGFYYKASTKQLYTIIDSFDYHDLQLFHTFSTNFPNALVFSFMAHALAGASYSRSDWNMPIMYATKSKGW